MKVYLGFDDTDVLGAAIGTGRLVRMYEDKLPEGTRLWGVLRHQLLVDERIPYTSHNSPACAVVEVDDAGIVPELIDRAIAHIGEFASPGSDPGLCVAREDAAFAAAIDFGLACTNSIRTQDEAMTAAKTCGIHLSGHGGTNDGIIGATAAVGLSVYGWSGRFIEFGRLREMPSPIRAEQLLAYGIQPVSLDRDASVIPPDAVITSNGWLSPRLWGGRPVQPVQLENGCWTTLGKRPRDAKVAE